MADFDGFEDNFGQPVMTDEDPAAEFLAREQDELAGLVDDNFGIVNGGTVEAGSFDGFAVVPEMNGPLDSELEMPAPQYQQPQRTKEVPEKIRKWKEEQEKMLAEKDAEEERKKEELKENAKKELEEWYKHHSEQIEKTRAQNRNAEKEYVMERDADVPGQEWEHIAKLCDFNPKSSKNTKDVSRMRSIILQLKQTPPSKS